MGDVEWVECKKRSEMWKYITDVAVSHTFRIPETMSSETCNLGTAVSLVLIVSLPSTESLSKVNTSRFVTAARLIHSLSSPPVCEMEFLSSPLSSELVNKGLELNQETASASETRGGK